MNCIQQQTDFTARRAEGETGKVQSTRAVETMKLGVQSGTLIGTEGWVINRKENISERRVEQTGGRSVCYQKQSRICIPWKNKDIVSYRGTVDLVNIEQET